MTLQGIISTKHIHTLALAGLSILSAAAAQTIDVDASRQGKRFDGIGIVNGGGATFWVVFQTHRSAEQQALIKARTDVETGGEYLLDEAVMEDVKPYEWHSLKLRMEGDRLTGYVDGRKVVEASSSRYPKGMAGLLAPLHERSVSTPCFDNLRINPLSGPQTPKELPIIKPLYN